MWGYQTADAMDGRQGKRVGMYVHPSTELFDHGIDGLVTTFSGIPSIDLLGLGRTPRLASLHLCCVWSHFYRTTWRHLYTGKLTFSAGIANPTEGLVCAVSLCLFLGFNPHTLDTTVEHIGTYVAPALLIPKWTGSLQIREVLIVTEVASTVSIYARDFSNLVSGRQPLRPGLSICQLAPLFLLWCFSLMYFWETDAPRDEDRATILTLAAFVNLSIFFHLIICEMTKTCFPAAWIVMSTLPSLASVFFARRQESLRVIQVVATIGALRFCALWLRFQRAVVYYCGMDGPFSVQ